LIADRFQKTASYTNTMLEELLEWTNSQSNKFEQHVIEFDLHSLAEKLFKNYQIKAEEKNLSLIYEGPNEIYIKSDPQLLEVVIRNLLTNAIKFSFPNNTIKIAIEKNPIKDHLLMHVIDNGIGIDQSKMKILFDSDVNKIKRGTFNEKGTGVGLLICKNLCNVLGVQIFAQSTPLVETRFTLKISTENSQPTNR
jgi:signal transduction histidine kinase